MASSLQEQLQRLAAAAGISSAKTPRGKPSLLYTFQEAADVGIQDIYVIAVQGFDQLCRIDPRFQSYRKTLFSQSTQTLDRDQQTAEIIAKLDASIAGFCHLLSSYFLLPAAFKALEYLIRRFKVNEMNIPALMHAALPYHATNEFVRLVQTLRLDNNNAILFSFLAPMQKSGVALPRELLVQRCLTDRGLLRFVCDAGQELGGARVAARTAMPFLAALLCEVVAAAPAVDESLMAMLLPYIIHGLSADVSPDYRAAIYMVLVQLATRATFTSDLICAIVLELCKSVTPAGLPQVLLVLCHLAVTQPALSVFPENAFKHLAKLPALAGELRILVNKGASRSQKLLALLTTAVATHVISHENYARLMDELLTTVPLGPAAAAPAAETLLAMAANTGIVSGQRTAVIKTLRIMDLRYPDVTEKAVNAALQKLKDTNTAVEKREHLSSALQAAFTGSLRAPMLEAGTTLALAVDAASAGIRRLALEKLDAIASGSNNAAAAAVGDNNEDDGSASRVEAEQVLRGALLRRLSDEHPAVVQTVLGMHTLLKLPPAALLESLSSCLATALVGATKKGANKGDRAASRGIARKIIKLLAGEFIIQNPEDVDRAAELLLTAVLAAPHTRKVAETAVKRGGKVENHPLLQGLKNADIESAQLKAATTEAAAAVSKSTTRKGKSKSTEKKEKTIAAAGESSSAKGYDDNLHNTIVIQALATKAAESTDAQRALAVLLGSTEPRTKALALAVANAVLHLDGGALVAEAVLQCFSASSGVQNGQAGSNEAAAVSLDEKTGLAEGATLLALANGTLHPRQVQPAVVLTALRVLPSTSLKSLGLEGLTRLFTRLCALPSASWGQHLEVLVARASEIVDSVQLLADLWGAPAAARDNNTKVHVSALRLWTQAVVSGSILPALSNAASPTSKAAGGRGKTQARAAVLAALPGLLRVLGHTEATMRSAGVEACGILAAEIDAWWGATSTTEATAKSGALDKDTTAAVLNSIVAQAGPIKSDSEAAESLLRNSLEKEQGGASTSGAAASPESASKKSLRGGSKKTSAKTSVPAFAGVRLALDSFQATSLKGYLLKELPNQHGPAGLDTVPFTIQVVNDSADPVALLLAAKDLLGTFALQEAPHLMLRPLRTSLERSVAALLVELYNDVAMTALLSENGGVDAKEGNAKDVVDSLLAMLMLPGAEGSTDVRRVALAAVTPVVFAVLPEEAQRAAFVALVAASTQDSDQGCRDAAHASLASLPLTADILIPLLTVESTEDGAAPASSGKMTGPARRKQRRASHEPSSPAAAAAPTPAGGLGAGFSSFLATLEVLQWKDDVENAIQLVPQLQNALEKVLDSLARHAAATKEQNNGGCGDGDGQQGEQNGIVLDDDGDSSGMQAAQAYAMQLTLALLHTLARHHVHPAAVSAGLLEPTGAAARKGKKKAGPSATSDTPFDIAVAVRCAQDAPDVAVRSAALSLVGTLAAAMPQAALGHVLTIVSVVGDASSELIDAHSSAVAAQCLGAVATAWVSSGGDAQELVDAVVGCAAAAPVPRRLPLLRALAAALPEVAGMCMVLLGLLNRHIVDEAAVEEAKKKKKKKQAKDVQEDDEDEDDQWALSAAKALLQKCSSVIQAKTMGSLLELAMEETSSNPAAPLVLISTAFITTRLESIPSRLLAESSNAREVEQEEEKELQAAYDVLMERALSQLQKTGELSAKSTQSRAAPGSSAKNSKVPSPEFLRTSMKAIYALTDALRHVMTPAAYISGLVGLIGPNSKDKVRRRALSLLSTAIRSSAERNGGGTGGKQREPAPALVAAALAAVGPVTAVLSLATASCGAAGSQKRAGSLNNGEPAQRTTELTCQVALGTLGSLAQAFGARHPQPFIAAVPVVLELTKPDQRQAVRGSALACVAALAQSLGRQIIPVLPPTVNAVLLAAQNAAKAISDTSVAAAAVQAGEEEDDSDPDEENNGGAVAAPKTVSEMASLELAASLSAIVALVDSLGAFLAPHLPQLFEVVLSPAVLACHQAHCSVLAESIRTRLSRDIPARLLLATLAESLDRAAAAGAEAACALLGMLRLAIESMDSDAIASYHETVFLQLLRALDLRRLEASGPVLSIAADAVEAAALDALVELTMKLSETRFKPLFFRLVEWATASAPPAVDSSKAAAAVSSSPLPRAVALLAAANVLSERLRSVFTPYFQPLMDPIIAALGHEGTSAGGPTKKKRKKSGAALLLGKDGDFPPQLAPLEATLRLLAVRSLHRCFMHDTAGFLDETRFDRLLQPLVSQLHVAPDPEVLPLLQPDSGLEAALGPEAKENLDIPARAVIACLAQMALAPGGSDGRWRPLNHAVLMATRAGELRTRLAALEGVAALANALQEEYLVLLPEALPFLAELLEDGQHEVEARAATTLRALETLSGEDLKEYLK